MSEEEYYRINNEAAAIKNYMSCQENNVNDDDKSENRHIKANAGTNRTFWENIIDGDQSNVSTFAFGFSSRPVFAITVVVFLLCGAGVFFGIPRSIQYADENTWNQHISAPIVSRTRDMPASAVSTINIPFSVDFKAVESQTNKHNKIDTSFDFGRKVLYDKVKIIHIYCNANIHGWIKRLGSIQIYGENGHVRIQLPIHLQATADAFHGLCSIIDSATVDSEMTLKATVDVDIAPDWTPVVRSSGDFDWIKEPEIVAFHTFHINVKKYVEPVVRKALQDGIKKVPSYVEELALPSKMEDLWSRVQDPVLLSDSPRAFLLIKPKSVFFSGFIIEKDCIIGSIGVDGEARVAIPSNGSIPKEEKIPLPGLLKGSPRNNKFSLNLPIFISLTEVERFLNDKYKGGYKVSVGLDISGNRLGTEIVLSQLRVSGNENGILAVTSRLDCDDLYVHGDVSIKVLPQLMTANYTICVESIDVEGRTDNEILNKILSFVENDVNATKAIAHLLVYDYEPNLSEALKRLSSVLNRDISDLARLVGEVEVVKPESLGIGKDEINVEVLVEGKVSIAVDFW